jgi:hypothetical protein
VIRRQILQEKTSHAEMKENQSPRKKGKAYERPFRRLLPLRKKPNLSRGPSCESRHPCLPQGVSRLEMIHCGTGKILHFGSIEGTKIVYECKEDQETFLLCKYQDEDQENLQDHSWDRLVDSIYPSNQRVSLESLLTPAEWDILRRKNAMPAVQAIASKLFSFMEKHDFPITRPVQIIKAILERHGG